MHSVWPVGRFAEYPQLLTDAGYFVGTYRKAWGPGRGSPAGTPYKSVDAFFDARPRDKPFCFWFGSQDPHRPYERGAGERSAWTCRKCISIRTIPTRRRCAAMWPIIISRSSVSIARWANSWKKLQAMGELENTLFVVTSDHGMPFPRGKTNLYDCGVHVPLAIRWPARVSGGRTVTDLVSLTDLAPTFLPPPDYRSLSR